MELFRLSLGCICLLPWLEGKFLLLWGSWKAESKQPHILTHFPSEVFFGLQSSEPTSSKTSALEAHFKAAFKMGSNAGVQESEGQAGRVLGWLGQGHCGIMLAAFIKCF